MFPMGDLKGTLRDALQIVRERRSARCGCRDLSSRRWAEKKVATRLAAYYSVRNDCSVGSRLIVAAVSVAGLRAQTVPTTFPDRPTDALINLDRVAQNVAERFQLYNRDIFQKLAADIGWLEGQAPSWPASENTEGFIRSISYTTASLQALLDGVRKDVIPVVETARRDTEINARQCRTMGEPSSVQVSVVTRDKSRNEVGGYEVWYARKAFENVVFLPPV